MLLLLLVVLLAACGADDDTEEPAAEGGEAVEIVGTDFAFDPKEVKVEAGESTFTFVNDGGTAHALEIEGGDVEEESETIGPGESTSLVLELAAGRYELYCPIANHRDLGMEGTLVVGGGGAGATGTGKTETDSDYGYGG